MTEAALSLDGVHAGYGKMEVLKGISLEVNRGEIVTLIGANGAGKSTALGTICGLVRVRSGMVRLFGQPVTNKAPHELVKLGLCQVPEGRRLFSDMTVMENLEMGAYVRRDRREIRADFEMAFSLFPVLLERRRQLSGSLSGGEQQMCAIARALMARPRILLLDEPSLGLAPILVQRIFAVIRDLNRAGTTILLVEQNANAALALANRGYVLETGTITHQGAAKTLAADPRVREAYLGK